MIKEYEDIAPFSINGTIIDFETIGSFNNQFNDHRQYSEIEPVVFGTLEGDLIKIYYIEEKGYLEEFLILIEEKLSALKKPFWAFNKQFEQGLIYNCFGKTYNFHELQKRKYESKKQAVAELNIPNFNDPFYDKGALAMKAWNLKNFKECIQHNRACLLKELMIWKHRYGFQINFIKI